MRARVLLNSRPKVSRFQQVARKRHNCIPLALRSQSARARALCVQLACALRASCSLSQAPQSADTALARRSAADNICDALAVRLVCFSKNTSVLCKAARSRRVAHSPRVANAIDADRRHRRAVYARAKRVSARGGRDARVSFTKPPNSNACASRKGACASRKGPRRRRPREHLRPPRRKYEHNEAAVSSRGRRKRRILPSRVDAVGQLTSPIDPDDQELMEDIDEERRNLLEDEGLNKVEVEVSQPYTGGSLAANYQNR